MDRTLDISTGKGRAETNWKQKHMTWDEFVSELRDVRRTPETMAEYDLMDLKGQGDAKNGRSYVGGTVLGGRRLKSAVESRSMITLDADDVTDGSFLDMVEMTLGGLAYAVYSTHSHREDEQKFRVVAPLDRDVTPDEYAAISRKIAEEIGWSYFDETCFRVHQLMYFPSCSSDADPVLEVSEGDPIDADEILDRYEDWKDVMSWPGYADGLERTPSAKMQDPGSKTGVVGAFCRAYGIAEAIETFIPDAYEETAMEDRWTFSGSESHGGMVVYDDDTFAYSHHESDPISGREVNAFDLVRLHLFGDMDDDKKSYDAMCELAANDPAVKLELSGTWKARATAQEEFGVLEDDEDDFDIVVDEEPEADNDDWMSELETNHKTGEVKPNSRNIQTILTNPPFKGALAFDSFKNSEVIRRRLPWRGLERPDMDYEPWLGADDKQLQHFLSFTYDIKASSLIQNAFTHAVRMNKFHPIKNYLERLRWDGVKRLETLFVKYLGTEDTSYTRTVTLKMFVAAIKRVYQPGCKFDEVCVLQGPQGCGKSTIIARMGRQWFSDSLKTFDSKEAGEYLQNSWIFEFAELSAMKKADVEEIKAFTSKTTDMYRVAYDRVVSEFPRKSIFFGTTNNFNFLKDETGNRRFWPIASNMEKRTKNPLADDSLQEEEIEQLWAEAKALYDAGYSTVMTDEEKEMAKEVQARHTEADPRDGMIQAYLDSPPDEFADLNEKRTKVCALEIWCNALGKNKGDMKNWDSRYICDTVRRVPGWKEQGKQRFKDFGAQLAFVRTDETSGG